MITKFWGLDLLSYKSMSNAGLDNLKAKIFHQLLKILLYTVCLFTFCIISGKAQGQDYYKLAQEEQDPKKKIEYLTKSIELKADNDALFDRAWVYLDQNRFNLAIKDLKSALKIEGSKTQFDILGSLAFAYYAIGKYEQAVEYANQSLKLKPQHTYSIYYRGWANAELGKLDEAEADFTSFINYMKLNSNGFYARQFIYYKKGEYQKALKDINKALSIAPSNSKYIEAKILILNRLGQTTEVDSLLGQIVKIIQDDPLSLTNVGNLFYSNGDGETALLYHNRAVELYEAKLKKDPKFAETHKDDLYNIYLSRGNAYLLNKKAQQALADFVRATDVKPKEFLAWNRIGQLQTFEQNYKEAIKAYERSFLLNPNYEVGWVNLGYAYSELNMRQEAINVYNRALKIEKVDAQPLLYNNRGFCHLELKSYNRAYEDIRKAIELDPELPMPQISLGEYLIEIKKYPEAIQQLTFALDMENKSDKETEVGYFKRGLAYLYNKQFDEALQDFTVVLDKNPLHIETTEKMGILYYEKKEYCLARKYLQNARQLGYKNPKQAPRLAEEYIRRVQTAYPKPCP